LKKSACIHLRCKRFSETLYVSTRFREIVDFSPHLSPVGARWRVTKRVSCANASRRQAGCPVKRRLCKGRALGPPVRAKRCRLQSVARLKSILCLHNSTKPIFHGALVRNAGWHKRAATGGRRTVVQLVFFITRPLFSTTFVTIISNKNRYLKEIEKMQSIVLAIDCIS